MFDACFYLFKNEDMENKVLSNLICLLLRPKKIYVCFRFPDPTYIFGPTVNILC